MNYAQAIQWKYPNADSLLDFKVESANGVQYLVEWKLLEPKPNDEEIYQWWVEFVRESKLAELSIACQSSIYAGFTATNGHSYQFEEKDQGNIGQQLTLLLLDPLIASIQWKTKDAGIVVHTRDEFIALANDANNHKRSNMGKYWTLEAQVNSASTEEEINIFAW